MTTTLTALVIIMAVTGLGVWLLKKWYDKESISVPEVRAGKLHEHMSLSVSEAYRISPLEKFYYEGKRVNPRRFVVARVDGDCMSPRGVYPGNLIFVEPCKSVLKVGDILYIQYFRDGFSGYKIREYRGEDGDKDYVTTAYYTAEGIPKFSKHRKENIKGVVKYNFSV